MPIWEFKCQRCQHVFETLVRSHDHQQPTCPACGSEVLQKLVSGFSYRGRGGAGSNCAGCTGRNCATCR